MLTIDILEKQNTFLTEPAEQTTLGLAWLGLAWLGLAWLGLAWGGV